MKKLSRLLSFISAFFGTFTLLRSPPGRAGGLMWLPKLWAGAWAPFLALAGGLGALLGLMSGDKAAFWSGLFGALAGYRHTVRVTRQQDSFNQTFGSDWEQRIRPDLWVRSQRPYQLTQPVRPLSSGQRNVSIGNHAEGGKPLLCDVWTPPNTTQRSGLAVIYLHGSLWQALDKDFLTRPLFGRLVHQGHVVLDLAYSLAPETNLSNMIREVKWAIGWVKSHAPEYGVNADRVVLMGNSGGAHLALLAAYTPGHPALQPMDLNINTSVRAVVSLYGITDLAAFFNEYRALNPSQPEYSAQISDDLRPHSHDQTRFDRLITHWRLFPAYRFGNIPGSPLLLVYLLGGTLQEVPNDYRLFSPITHVGPHCPPTLQIFGDNDFVIDASHGRRLHQALQKAGIPSVYIEFPDTVHGFDQTFGVSHRVAPAAQMATNDIEQFLALMAY
jgi:acetyl esterase/lipase